MVKDIFFAFVATATFVSIFVFILSMFISEVIKINYSYVRKIWMTLIISLAGFCFFIEPHISDDLYKHYLNIELYREGILYYFNWNTAIFHLFMWLISLTPANGLLPFLAVVIFGCLLEKITSDYAMKCNTSKCAKLLLIYLGEALAGTFIIYLVTGIRSCLVCAIWAYAYHFYFHHYKFKYYVIMVFSCLIHPITIILTLITWFHQILMTQKKDYIQLIFLAFILLIINSAISSGSFFVELLRNTNINYLLFLSTKIGLYSNDDPVMISLNINLKMIACILLLSILLLTRSDRGDDERNLLTTFLLVWCIGIQIPIIQDRLPYAIGMISFPAIRDANEKSGFRLLFNILLSILISLQILAGLYELLADADFNGIYYRDIIRSMI